MWETVELREIRVFLVLAEELHFGHTAERLGISQSRVSQTLRVLERKLGQELVRRTSRHVTLTPAGERFRTDVSGHHDQLVRVLRRTRQASTAIQGPLRLGVLEGSCGPQLFAAIKTFEARHPHCELIISEAPVRDPFGPLRRGEIDLMSTRLPLEEPDLEIGPTLSRDPRVLAVARDHPLAAKAEVSIEDVADHQVVSADTLPGALQDAWIPRTTPAGRPIRRLAQAVDAAGELALLIARGKVVQPTVPSMAVHVDHPGIAYVPISDMPPSSAGLVWLRGASSPSRREFLRVAGDVLGHAGPAAGIDERG